MLNTPTAYQTYVFIPKQLRITTYHFQPSVSNVQVYTLAVLLEKMVALWINGWSPEISLATDFGAIALTWWSDQIRTILGTTIVYNVIRVAEDLVTL